MATKAIVIGLGNPISWVRHAACRCLLPTATARKECLMDRTVLSRYPMLDSEQVTRTKGDEEEVTKTKDDKRVSNSFRGQGTTALYETTDKRIKLGVYKSPPGPTYTTGQVRAVAYSTIEVLGPPMSQSRNNREGGQYESVLEDNNRSPNNKELESSVQLQGCSGRP